MTLAFRVTLLALLASACASAPDLASAPASIAQMQEHPERLIVVAVANPVEPVTPRAGSTPRGYDIAPRYSVSGAARASLGAVMHSYHLREVAAWPIVDLELHCAVLEIPEGASRDELLRTLSQDSRVRLAQPLQGFKTMSGDRYNDPYIGLQRGFATIEAAGAQQWSSGHGVRVAIVDTGVDMSHPDLKGRMGLERNFVDGDARGFSNDHHGTAIAGVIAAVANNHEGIVGIAPEVELMAFKACWQTRVDSAQCNSFTLAQAITAALDSGAQVVNLSLAGPADPLLSQIVMHGIARGAIVVGAVPPDGRLDGFPAGVPGVIAVDAEGAKATAGLVLHAPGSDIITLTPGGHYDYASGSSLAAAHVSGTIALMLRESRSLNAQSAHDLLQKTSLQGVGGDAVVNACAAMLALRTSGSCAEALRGVATISR